MAGRDARGVGIQYLAMLVRPEEITQGEIQHALSMPISNPSKEHLRRPGHQAGASGTDSGNEVPEGMRFAMDMTDAQINPGLLPNLRPTRKLARTVGRALRDYGWFITDTSGADSFSLNLRHRPMHCGRRRGSTRHRLQRELLDGLITQSRIYTIVPSDQYPNQSLAPPNPPTGLIVN